MKGDSKMEKCCGNCKFFEMGYVDEANGDVGECTRFPPQLVNLPKGDYTSWDLAANTKFPILSYVRLCGEYRS